MYTNIIDGKRQFIGKTPKTHKKLNKLFDVVFKEELNFQDRIGGYTKDGCNIFISFGDSLTVIGFSTNITITITDAETNIKILDNKLTISRDDLFNILFFIIRTIWENEEDANLNILNHLKYLY